MDLIVFIFLLVLVPPLNCGVVSGKGRSLQASTMHTSMSQDLPSKDPVRHGRKKKNKAGGRRERRKQQGKNGLSKVYGEKEFLVHNRTLELLGDEVQRILNSAKAAALQESPSSSRQKNATNSERKRSSNITGSFRNKVQSSFRLNHSNNSYKFLSTRYTNGSKVSTINNNNNNNNKNLSETNLEIISYIAKEDYIDFSTLKEEKPVNFNTAIKYFVEALTNYTASNLSSLHNPCEKWIICNNRLQDIFLGPLPSCPCKYPSGIFYDDKLWDESEQRFYRWKDASAEAERLDIYKSGAEYCIRSLLSHTTTSLSVQHCCYDRDRKLITRGSGAGNPNYVSPDVSKILHDKLDILPWRLCKGDFTKYNIARPPNNGNSCKVNPNEAEYNRQVKEAASF